MHPCYVCGELVVAGVIIVLLAVFVADMIEDAVRVLSYAGLL